MSDITDTPDPADPDDLDVDETPAEPFTEQTTGAQQ